MRKQGEHIEKVTDALFYLKEATASLRPRLIICFLKVSKSPESTRSCPRQLAIFMTAKVKDQLITNSRTRSLHALIPIVRALDPNCLKYYQILAK